MAFGHSKKAFDLASCRLCSVDRCLLNSGSVGPP